MKKTHSFLLFGLCLSLGLSSCTEEIADHFSEPFVFKIVNYYKGNYTLGQPIDLENFFFASNYSYCSYRVEFPDLDFPGRIIKKDIIGHIYYPEVVGEHTFFCTAKEQTLEYTIMVEYQDPTLSISDESYFIECGDAIVRYETIKNALRPKIDPASLTPRYKAVKYTPYQFNFELEEQSTYIETFEEGFFAKNPGKYTVEFEVVNGDKKVNGEMNVIAGNSFHDGNARVHQTEGRYDSYKVITSEEYPHRFLLPACDRNYSDSAYVALNDIVKTSQFIGINFKGRNLPQIGFACQPGVTGSYAMTSLASGMILTMEKWSNEHYNIYDAARMTSVKDNGGRKSEQFGYKDLDPDKYYHLTYSMVRNNKQFNSITGKDEYLRIAVFKIYEILRYGYDDEHLSAPLVSVWMDGNGNYTGGWWDGVIDDDYSVGGNIVFYASKYGDSMFEVCDPNAYRSRINENHVTIFGQKADTHYQLFDISHYRLEEPLDFGQTLTMKFQGKNAPNVCVLADENVSGQAMGNPAFGVGQGIYFCNSFQQGQISKVGADSNQHKIVPYGPYKWGTGNKRGDRDMFTAYRYQAADGVPVDSTTWNKGGYLDYEDQYEYEYSIGLVSLGDGVLTFNLKIKNLTLDHDVVNLTNVAMNLLDHLNEGDTLALGRNVILYGQCENIEFDYRIE